MYSVIIPSLGRFDYLSELLTSILAQRYLPGEILILLDNNLHCKNGSALLEVDPSIRLVFCESLNLAQKRNYGASIAAYDLLLFSDDDDVWHPERASRVIPVLSKYLVCCHNYDKFGAIIGSSLSQLGKYDAEINIRHLLRGVNIFGGGSSIATHRSLIASFPFDTNFIYCEDFEWWSRVILSGITIFYIATPLVSYRTHSSNMTASPLRIYKFNLKIAYKCFEWSTTSALVALSIIARTLTSVLGGKIRGRF
jgi:glycosyltransferase involved in cell wall biosynthesis